MTARGLLLALKARWYIVVACAAAGLMLALLATVFARPSYVAKAEVLVSVENPETVESETVINPPELAAGYLETQSDIIRSDRTLDRVVELLGLSKDPVAMGRFRARGGGGDPGRFFADQLRSGLVLTTAYPSRVIGIGYVSGDAEFAARVANAFADAYQSVSLDLQLTPAQRSLAWYEKAAKTMSAQLAEAQQRLAASERTLAVTASKDEVDAEGRRLDALSQALAAAQAGEAASAARAGGGALPDAMLSPVVQRLQSDIAQLESERRQLSVRAGPNNVEMREITGRLAGLRGELAQQQGNVARSAQASAQAMGRNVSDLELEVARQKQRVIESRSRRGEVGALQQEVNAISRSYDALVERQSKASLLGSGEQTNVTVLSRALTPERRSGLRPLVKLLAGLILGSALGILVAVAAELLDRRIRGSADAERVLGITNLGWIGSSDFGKQGTPRAALIRSWLPW